MSLAIRTWFRAANLVLALWIPAFAGMTGERAGITGVGRERE